MIRHLSAAAVLCAMLAASPVQAKQATVVLTVEKATCVLCAPIVKRALSSISGVKSVKMVEADGMTPAVATVTFDDALTNVPAFIAATTNLGYPSHLAN